MSNMNEYNVYILNKSENATHLFQLKNSSYFVYRYLLYRQYAWLTACSQTLENPKLKLKKKKNPAFQSFFTKSKIVAFSFLFSTDTSGKM